MEDKIDHEVAQDFEVNDEVLSADLDVWAKWQASVGNGLVEFIVYVQKPDLTNVELYNNQYTDGASGQANILSNLDVKAHLSQQGTYKLRLLCGARSNDDFICSYGWYDNISLDIKIKKIKVILEQLAAIEDPQRKSSSTKSESLSLSEALSKQKVKSILESLSLSEAANRLTKKSVLEALSLVEHYLETDYIFSESLSLIESYFAKLSREQSSILSLIEALSARRTAGNIITTFDITDLIVWDDRSKVTTKWDKVKTIIN